jgi:catechol 2,3-dioxygenase-like lactoylglutathione lyase family enzyme
MLSHVTIGTADLARAKAFYDRVIATLGIGCIADEPAHGLVGYAEGPATVPQFYLVRPIDGRPAAVGNGQTIAFVAPDRATVWTFHAAALAAGGSCAGPPGLRPHYHADYYGAYVRDLDGHKIACVCHLPEG